MLIYCLKSRRKTKSIDAIMIKTKNIRLALLTKCPACASKKSIFMKEQEAEGLLSNLVIQTPLSKTPLLNVLF